MTNSETLQKTSFLYNVQHTSHTSNLKFFLHYHILQKISFYEQIQLPIF